MSTTWVFIGLLAGREVALYQRLRFESPKNNQSINIKYTKDYLIDNILCVETLHKAPKDHI